jgi:hypothetical protein
VVDRGFIGGVMVSVLPSSVVDRGFIGGVMVSVLPSSVVDRGFIGGVMVSVLPSSVVDRGFEPPLGKTKDYTIGICCFSAKHAVVLRRRSKDWLARNHDNVQIIANISTKCVAIFSVMFDVAISHNHRIGKLLACV